MKRFMSILGRITLWLLALVGALSIVLVAVYWQLFIEFTGIVDRLYLRPCYYYPETLINCEPNKEGAKDGTNTN